MENTILMNDIKEKVGKKVKAIIPNLKVIDMELI
jgi:hypothetical protein